MIELSWFGGSPWAALCLVLTAVLGAYSAVYWFGALGFLLRGRRETAEDVPSDGVTVLIPARDEGAGALRAIRSVLEQDHGDVHVQLLLADAEDTAIPHLRDAFPDAMFDGDIAALTDRASVVFTGVGPKHSKIDAALPSLQTPYVAILDADHVAHPDWISASLARLAHTGGRIVQGCRQPLDVPGFFGLWDSLHQHVGCEVFNAAYDRAGLTTFFTGTTAVMETSLLRTHPLHDCITEDVDFAYRIVQEGERIHSLAHRGSAEEVSPDLYSFVARRRRWANGHTDAFLRHLKTLPGSKLSLVRKLQLLLHGGHYLVSAVVFLLHLAIGLWFLPELSRFSIGAASLVGLGLAGMLVRGQGTAGLVSRLGELVVSWLWFTPGVVIAMNLAMALARGELHRAALPLPHVLQALGVVGFVAPLALLVVGMIGMGTPFRRVLAAVATYPAAFYVDVGAVLIGLGDRLWGRPVWRPVHRAVASQRGIWALMKPTRWVPAVLLLGVFVAGALYSPAARMPVLDAKCEVMEHDGDPWIVPATKLDGYCQANHGERWSRRTGTFEVQRADAFTAVDGAFWDTLDSTFFCNQAHFQPQNVSLVDEGLRFTLKEEQRADRAYTSGNIATKDVPDAHYLYGRFETVMKPAKGSGTLTAFFLYRFDPWQEIDAEFVGRDTSKLLINVFYNPGEEGDLYNYGYRGTPVMVDLGFDASEDFHTYAIEWDPEEIRWFVDDRIVHRRAGGRPTPIPHLPMRFHVNLWPTCSEELAGPMDPSALPAVADVRSVTISTWEPPPRSGLMAVLQRVLPARGRSGDWREKASWIQPGR